MNPKVLTTLGVLVLISGVILFNLYSQTKSDIRKNYTRYISTQGSWEPQELTEEQFFEKLSLKGLDDAQAAIESIATTEVSLCRDEICKLILEKMPFTYYPQERLEQELYEGVLGSLGLTPDEQITFLEKSKKMFLPDRRDFFKEYGKLEILEDKENYYFWFLPNLEQEGNTYKFKADFFDRIIADLKINLPKESDAYKKVEELGNKREEILSTFILGFSYEVPKSTFRDKKSIQAFFVAFNDIPNRWQIQEKFKTMNTYNDLLVWRVNIEKLNVLFSQIFARSLYKQIFEKPSLLPKEEVTEEPVPLQEEK